MRLVRLGNILSKRFVRGEEFISSTPIRITRSIRIIYRNFLATILNSGNIKKDSQ